MSLNLHMSVNEKRSIAVQCKRCNLVRDWVIGWNSRLVYKPLPLESGYFGWSASVWHLLKEIIWVFIFSTRTVLAKMCLISWKCKLKKMARQLRVHDAHEKTGLITDKYVVDAAGVRCHGNNTLCLFANKNFKLKVLFLQNSRTVRVYLGISPPLQRYCHYMKRH